MRNLTNIFNSFTLYLTEVKEEQTGSKWKRGYGTRADAALGQMHTEQRINKKQKNKDTKSWSLRPAGTCGGACL